jgi:hypothetical protein
MNIENSAERQKNKAFKVKILRGGAKLNFDKKKPN